MNKQPFDDLSGMSMLELFRVEAETQTAMLTSGLLELERGNPTGSGQQLETLMRAAHSLKGAARIVGVQAAVRLAHAMEDCLVAAQHKKIVLGKPQIDVLFRGVDLILHISKRTEADLPAWETEHAPEIQEFLSALNGFLPGHTAAWTQPAADQPTPPPATPKVRPDPTPALPDPPPGQPIPSGSQATTEAAVVAEPAAPPATRQKHELPERVVRLNAESLNRLLGLAGESLVESRWLRPFSDSMQRLKRVQADLERSVGGLRDTLQEQNLSDRARAQLGELTAKLAESRQFLGDRLQDLDLYDRRAAHLSHRLYLEVLRTRMRPFADGARRFPRMVRDLARSLGKEVRFEIIGENTQVDRDILERLETPLAHLLRNAVDHGCEPAEQRRLAGKSPEAAIQLEARHSAGMLLVSVTDDGGGVDPERIRRQIIEKRLTAATTAGQLTDAELLEFLFLPGFTLKDAVTEISGRGVGLDVVQNMVKSVRGNIRVSTQPGQGMRFQLQLPLTLSVLRTLLVEIAGEPYAVPLAQIIHTLRLPREQIETLEGRYHFRYAGQQVSLLAAHQVLDCGTPTPPGDELPVVVLGDRTTHYGLVVDRFLGERELVVQPLDPRLGKVKDINAAALMEDGAPVLIADVEDIVRSIEKLIAGGRLAGLARGAIEPVARRRKRVLAVDDSLTVRELERKLLAARGYQADVAVDGMDGWNALRTGNYDLVITDVDMPRLDGVELTRLIKKDPELNTLPVMIVSYKDREEDRLRGLEAGADYYLTKGSFNDETLVQAVFDLIGEPET